MCGGEEEGEEMIRLDIIYMVYASLLQEGGKGKKDNKHE